ncbi:9947_t:CDS:2 [Racocetra fulgida]|uniref:9947_t:CDS:1 n=1 Tax=Racocetra fulgida TaxID=60492 RepID=A0A9N9CL89_9GLOM|nr:9947_t:CDS:2 [Racocetra fulgida]
MPLLSKGKRKAKNQVRNVEGQYSAKKMGLTDQEDMVNEFNKLYNRDTEGELNVSNENGGEENGGWNKYNNELDSTYYDNYGPNGVFTKAAVGTKKITSFFTSPQPSDPNDLEEISDDSDSEPDSYALMINKKVNDLKKQLEQNHSKLTVKEYNYKRAIFEYLSLLSKNNKHEKIKASLDVARKLEKFGILRSIGYLMISSHHLDIENTKKQLE